MELCNPFQEDLVTVETDRSISVATFFQDNVESCVAYAKCQVIGENSRFPPALEQLPQICSEEALSSNPQDCIDACSDVKCCYDTTSEDSCIANQFLVCLDYAPCQNLRTLSNNSDGTFIYTAPPDLDEMCLPDFPFDGSINDSKIDHRDYCEDNCQAASCCLNEVIVSSAEGSCLQNNFISCLTYAPCGGLLIPPIHDKVPPPDDKIDKLCSVENILNDDTGYDDCLAVCSTGECCTSSITEAPSETCFLQDPIGCLEYLPCLNLMVVGGDIDMAPDDLNEICDLNVLKDGGEEAVSKCEEKCKPGSCCVDLDWQDNCVDEGNLLTCASYLPCSILYLMGSDTIPEPPEELSEVCSIFHSEYNATACGELCSQASCCSWNNRDKSCLTDNIMVCSHWSLYCFPQWTSSP